jgi:hypothetical protein
VHYRRRVAEALVGLALGAAMIAAGIVLPVIGLAVAGFVVMLLCSIWVLNSWRQMAAVALGAAPGQPAGKRRRKRAKRGAAGHASFGERLDERWRRRQEGGR